MVGYILNSSNVEVLAPYFSFCNDESEYIYFVVSPVLFKRLALKILWVVPRDGSFPACRLAYGYALILRNGTHMCHMTNGVELYSWPAINSLCVSHYYLVWT
jgi:hypothetical protein